MKKTMPMLSLLIGAALVLSCVVLTQGKEDLKSKSKKMGDVFFVFSDRGSRLNHYTPSGWMGDYGDLRLNNGWTKGTKKPDEGSKAFRKAKKASKVKEDTCIQVRYTGERKQGAGWSGVYFQHPANNWGDKRGGYDLSRYMVLKFWAKGEVGGEVFDKFFMGGITGQTHEGDSDEAAISPVQLTNEWKEYVIDLEGLDLSHIIGGFGFAANADANPDGFTAYVDEVRFEKEK